MRLYGFMTRIYNRNLSTFYLGRVSTEPTTRNSLSYLVAARPKEHATNVISWKQRVHVEAT